MHIKWQQGPNRHQTVLVSVYIVLFIAAFGRGLYQIIRHYWQAPFAYTLSAFAALVYMFVAVAFIFLRKKSMRIFAWVCVFFELVGVVVVGAVSFLAPELFAADTVWSGFGRGYLYVPLILPLVAIAYLEDRYETDNKNERKSNFL